MMRAACPQALGRTTMEPTYTRPSLYPQPRLRRAGQADLVGFVVPGPDGESVARVPCGLLPRAGIVASQVG
jgi:hypothetical protein